MLAKMRMNIPDLSNISGQIRQFVDFEQFEAMAKMLGVEPEKIHGFEQQTNQEIHELLKKRKRLKKKKDAKKRKRNIDFPSEIEKAAQNFQELVSKAPDVISVRLQTNGTDTSSG